MVALQLTRILLPPSSSPSLLQGMNLIREAAKQLGWSVDLGECARIWKGGCIIREWFACFLSRS